MANTSSEISTVDSATAGLRATQLIKIIPEYHGRPQENVHEFIDAVEEGMNLVKVEEKKILLAFLRTRLKGTAFKAIQYLTIDSWDQLREHLQRRFGVGDTIRYIEKEFTMLMQGNRENVAEFGERTCMLAAKITEFNIREKKYDADTFQKIMEDRVLVQFITGLKEPVRFQVKSYRCTEYQEALAIACNLEKEIIAQKDFDGRAFLRKVGLRDQASYQETPKCFTCGKSNHKSKDCYHRKNRVSNTVKVNAIQCYNCQKFGHIAKDCRSRTNQSYHHKNPHTKATEQQSVNQGNEQRQPGPSRQGRPATQYKSAQ